MDDDYLINIEWLFNKHEVIGTKIVFALEQPAVKTLMQNMTFSYF